MSATVRAGSGEMFDLIARRYDLLNRVLSLGLDQGWRRRAVQALQLLPGQRALDLATGTGDLALLIADSYQGVEVVGLDPSQQMMAIARDKAQLSAAGLRLSFVCGEAEALPFEARSFDAVSMAFGIRNVPDRPRALAEIARVLRPGGRAAILELAEPEDGPLAPLARLYIRSVVPRIGGLLSGASEYRHLQRSIAAFPRKRDFAVMMQQAGLSEVEARPLSFGVAVLFVARREA